MLGSDLVRLVAFATIPLVALFAELTFSLVLLVSVVEGVCGAIFAPAASATVRDVVADNADIPGALSKIQVCYTTLALVGPALGGLLFSIAPTLPFAVDAASYAISAVLLLRLRTPPPASLPANERDHRFTAGWRWLGTQTELLTTVLFGAVLNLASGAAYITLVLSLREQGTSSTAIGSVMACGVAGSLIGALLAPRLIRVLSTKGLIWAVGTVWTAGLAVFISTPPVIATAMIYSALLLISPAGGVLMGKLTLTAVPRDLLGRVRSAIDTGVSGLAIFGPILAGVAIERIGLSRTWLMLTIIAGTGTVIVAGPRWSKTRLRSPIGFPVTVAQPHVAAAIAPAGSPSSMVEAENS